MLKLELSPEMIDVIARGLGELPLKIAAPTFSEIQKQVTAQQAATPPPGGDK